MLFVSLIALGRSLVRKFARTLFAACESALTQGLDLCFAIETLENRRLLSSIVVNTTLDGAPAGLISLRDALAIANAGATPTTITFDPTVFATAQAIVLNGTELILSNTREPTTIVGPAAGVIISGNHASEVLYIQPNVTASISNVTITNGNASFWGGGIEDSGFLTLTNDTISNNFASYVGGGIYVSETGGAKLVLTDVTIANNVSASNGGGLFNDQASILNNVTISGNSAPQGGGITSNFHPEITTVLNNVTVSNNTAGNDGGGIWNDGSAAQVKLENTIVSGNAVTGSGSVGSDVYGSFISLGHNLIGKTDSSSGWIATDLSGTIAKPLNADLGSLQNNGGLTQTLLPQTGSPTIDSGSNTLIPVGIATDQRGLPRISDGSVDIGAIEVQGLNITNTTCGENVQSITGLVITPSGAFLGTVNSYQITNISGGSLFLNDGVTPVTDGEFITVAQGAAGLKFTPTNGSLAAGMFTIEASTTGDAFGLDSALTANGSVTVLAPTATILPQLHGTAAISWDGLGIDPSKNNAEVVAYKGQQAFPITANQPIIGSYNWDTTTVPDGQYEIQVSFHDSSGNVISQAVQQVGVNNSAAWYAGTISSNETWTNNKVNVVYGPVTVASGITLTIQPGAIVKFVQGENLQIVLQSGATLNAAATQASPIVFTSFADDKAGGDTNGDGDKSTSTPGDWGGFVAGSGASLSLSPYVQLRYLKQIVSGTLSSSETLLGADVYEITSTLIVPSGVTLSILPGAIVKFDAGQGITVQAGGHFIADGTLAEPIVFTSIKDDVHGGDTNGDGSASSPAAGDWEQIDILGSGSFDHTEVLYGSGIGNTGNDSGAVRNQGGTLIFSDSIISQALFDGLDNYGGGNTTITNCLFTATDRAVVSTISTTTIVNSTFDNNFVGMYLHVGGSITATNCIVSNSVQYGVDSDGIPIQITYSDVWNTATGAVNYSGTPNATGTNGNISVNPNYVDAANGNYRLNFGSPAIDTGNGAVAPSTDMLGDPRYNDPRTKTKTGVSNADGNYPDMGAYEFVESATSNLNLIVTSVVGPASAMAGSQALIQWTDANIGAGTAIGPWHDNVYLVSNPGPNQEEILAATVLVGQGVTLGPGQSSAFSATVEVPGDAAGSHYWAVQTNSEGDIFEGQNTANNTLVSSAPVQLSVPALPIDGATDSGVFTGVGVPQWFEFTPQTGQDVLISLSLSDSKGAAQLYIGQGYMPSPLHYDEAETQFNSPYATALAADTSGQAYYILAEPSSLSGASSAFTIQATSLNFQLTSASPNTVGNAGFATLELQGGKLTSNMTYQVVDPSGTTHTATAVYVVSSAVAYATFNLTGLQTGSYSIQVVSQGDTKTLANAVTVVHATPGAVQVTISGPSRARVGAVITLTVTYANNSLNDIPSPLLMLNSATGEFQLPGQTSWTPNTFQVLGISQVGPAGTLQPGYSGSIQVQYIDLAPTSVTASTYSVGVISPTANADWASLESSLDPSYIPATAWNVIYQNLTGMLGTTWGQYQTVLDQDATYLSQLGQSTDKVDQLFSFEVQQAIGYSPVASLATATDAQLATPGPPLSFSRTFGASILNRNQFGRFGWGWDDSWDTYFTVESSGNVDVYEPGGSIRQFQPNGSGGYTAQPGDHGTLTAISGAYTLTEVEGTFTAYNTNGSLNYVQDNDGNRISAGYTNGLLTSLTASSGQSLTLIYNAAKLVSSITDSTGRTTIFQYDQSNQYLISVTDFNGQTTTYSYDRTSGSQADHSLTTITYSGNTHQYYTYDNQGRLATSYVDGNDQLLTYSYSLGKVNTTDIRGYTSSEYYDARGLITKYVDPLGNVTLTAYDNNLNLNKLTDALGQSEFYTYNSVGDVTSSTDFLGNTTYFNYSGPFNQLASLIDANGNTTSYAYDPSGNLLSTTYANGTAESFTYNPEGDATSFVNPNGQLTNYTYNAAGQVTQTTFSDGSQYTYTYDNHGNLIAATDATGTTTFTYDPTTELLTEVAYPNGTYLKFRYNFAGQRTQMVDQTGFTSNYIYNAEGQLAGLTDGSDNQVVSYIYGGDGRLSQTTNGNDTYTTYAHDADGNVISLINYAPSGAINSSFEYTYNALGLETTETTLQGSWAYTYDTDGQLIAAVFASNNTTLIPNQNLAYSYDALGNRTVTIINGATTTYLTNNLNEYVSVGGVTYKYDTNGNLLYDGTNTYSYNSLNQLISVSGLSGTTTHSYNALGQLISSTANGQTTEYLIDPTDSGNVVGTYTENGSLIANYMHGIGLTTQVTTSGKYYYDLDALGSIVGLSDAEGIYVNDYSYLPFGGTLVQIKTIVNPFQFVGAFGVITGLDGLVAMGFRTYQPNLGRFIMEDPIGLAGGDLNLQRYATNNPVTYVDPIGTAGSGETNAFMPYSRIETDPRTGESRVTNSAIYDLLEDMETMQDNGNEQGEFHRALTEYIEKSSQWQPPSHIIYLLKSELQGDQLTQSGTELRSLPATSLGSGICPTINSGEGFSWLLCTPPKPSSTSTDSGSTQRQKASDPNGIVGPSAYGSNDFVNAASVLPYTIEFENSSTATASAGDIQITQQLDPNLDYSSFQLGNIELGNLIISIPVSLNSINEILDERSSLGVYVEVVAGLNPNTGVVTWILTALDPVTMQIPADPLLGLLPPDASPPEGEGSVSYTIRPKTSDSTGTIVNARASIIFDINAPIATSSIFETLDAGAPISSITALPATESTNSFTVSWSGQDDIDGSGIASYNIYVSVNGGTYSPWITTPTTISGTFTGQPGTTYNFYSVAADNVGNIQPTPGTAQASTFVLYQPSLTGLSGSISMIYGTASVSFSGQASDGPAYPTDGEVVAVTLNGVTIRAQINPEGQFSATFNVSSLPASATPYSVTYSYAGDALFLGVMDDSTTILTVAKATPTISANAPSTTYNALPYSFATAIITGVDDTTITGGTVVLTYYMHGSTTALTSAPTAAGTYDVVATFSGDSDYTSVGSKTATFTINLATPNVSIAAPNAANTGNPYNAAQAMATGVGGVMIADGSVMFTYYNHGSIAPLTSAPINVGIYDVIATFSGDANYSNAESSIATFNITATLQNVTPQLQMSKTTGTKLVRGSLVATQTLTITNNSGSAISGPLYLALASLSGGTFMGASFSNLPLVTGNTSSSDSLVPAGSVYVVLPSGSLGSGQSITVVVTFAVTNSATFADNWQILAGLGTV